MSTRLPLHPLDIILASTRFYSSLPVVGRHLEPFAGLTAMGLWGGHYAPAAVRAAINRRIGARPAAAPDETAALDEASESATSAGGSRVPPFIRFRAQRQRCLYRSSVQYGDHRAQMLDVWRQPDLPPGPAPVLLFVPGGAWVQGTRVMQGHTLLSHLVRQGVGMPDNGLPGFAGAPVASPHRRRQRRNRVGSCERLISTRGCRFRRRRRLLGGRPPRLASWPDAWRQRISW